MTGSCWCEKTAKTRFIETIAFFFLFISCIFFFPSSPTLAAVSGSTDNEFPIYPSIRPNVDFWVGIFTKYSKSHGVIHDINNLSIIYEVVPLDSSETVFANSCNQKIKAAAIQKYKEILLKLSNGEAPFSEEENKVATLFGPNATASDFAIAASNIRCQTGLSKEFKEGLIRAGAVLDEFKRIFKSHGLPADLVYLPCVESSYNFKAYSKLGAAGIWQFTHDTGKMYMDIDYVVDERRDPYISTDAAARLLKKNYEVLGEWPLAITAYNHGLTGMLRAKNAAGNYENIFKTYQGPSFKFASRNFYSEFLAARIVAKNHEKHFGNLRFQSPATFQTVKTKGYLMAKDLMTLFDLSADEIQALNPSLRPPVFTEQKYIPKGFSLKLPKTFSIYEIDNRLASLYKGGQKPSRFHKVQKGDTISSIARLHSIRVKDLISANDLGNKTNIVIGQNLRIPVKDEIMIAKKEPVRTRALIPEPPKSDAERPIEKPVIEKPVQEIPVQQPAAQETPALEKKPVEIEAAVAQSPEAPSPEPVISPNQEIDLKPLPVSIPDLKPVTGLDPMIEAGITQENKSSIEAGITQSNEPLIDPVFDAVAEPATEATPVNPRIDTSDLKILRVEKTGSLPIGIIKIEAEETLGHYAGWLKVTPLEIRKLNAFTPKDPISIDQKIKIPLNKVTAQAFEEKRYEFHKEMEEDFFSNFSIQGVETYEIKNGDNIWRLCENELEIPLWLLKTYNPDINFNSIQLKQKIKYPIISKLKTN
ncbi:MAG: LysM peptidoglycan-binding domain-containing protein [Desulfobacula sp.]|jgi:membrane-bound lytic murein transglycosylase D